MGVLHQKDWNCKKEPNRNSGAEALNKLDEYIRKQWKLGR